MITKTLAFMACDNTTHATLELAQRHEVKIMVGKISTTPFESGGIDAVTDWVIANQDKLVDILTTKPNSKPKARAINGGSKKRAPKVVIAAEAA